MIVNNRPQSAPHRAWVRLALVAGSLVVALAIFEMGARLLIEPSEISYGRLHGTELPPLKLLLMPPDEETDRSAPFGDLVVDGQRITRGDLWGLIREDEMLGYAPLESASSVNGWWQSNSLGARAREETPRHRNEGRRRALVFGESFTAGNRVRQEETWPHRLEQLASGWDMINLAVDGYSMGQSLLRYRMVRDRVEHDAVILAFVPREDLIREVNTLRSLLRWQASTLMPRFVVDGEVLKPVAPPYADPREMWSDYERGDTRRLKAHLEEYDAFYSPSVFDPPPVLGRLVAYKVMAAFRYRRRHIELREECLKPGSEAMRIASTIFETMAAEVNERGQRFVLVYIPNRRDVDMVRELADYRRTWERVVAGCPEGALCVDLLPGFPDTASLDYGYDGTHYGPEANTHIAEAVWHELSQDPAFDTDR